MGSWECERGVQISSVSGGVYFGCVALLMGLGSSTQCACWRFFFTLLIVVHAGYECLPVLP